MIKETLRCMAFLAAACAAAGGVQACSQSAGAPVCPLGFEECEGRCADFLADFSNCGGCGIACASSQEACISDGMMGVCSPFCGIAAVETKERLVELIAGAGMNEIEGVEKYVSVTGRVDLLPGEAGEGAIFLIAGGDIPGVTLGDEIQFGFDMDYSDSCCIGSPGLAYPVTGYRSASFQDTEFSFDVDHYEAVEGVCAGENPDLSCVSVRYSSSMECIYPSACCCSQDPVLWDVITLRPVQETCTTESTCQGLTGYHPSVCFDSVRQYVLGQSKYVHGDCIDDTGHVEVNATCTCEVGWDYLIPKQGRCGEKGRCLIESGDGNYVPPECSISG